MKESERSTVGALRMQSAYVPAETPVVLVSADPEVSLLLKKLQVTGFYPDPTDADGKWNRVFKIEIANR